MKRKKVSQERKKNPKAHFDLSAIQYKNWNESKVFPAVRFAYCFLFTLLGMCRTECFYRFRVCYENEWMEKKWIKVSIFILLISSFFHFPPSWALFPSNEHEIQASTCLSIHLTFYGRLTLSPLSSIMNLSSDSSPFKMMEMFSAPGDSIWWNEKKKRKKMFYFGLRYFPFLICNMFRLGFSVRIENRKQKSCFPFPCHEMPLSIV